MCQIVADLKFENKIDSITGNTPHFWKFLDMFSIFLD